jgi:hypothetical protein
VRIVIEVDPGELTPAMAERQLYLLQKEIDRSGLLAEVGPVRLGSPWVSFKVDRIVGKIEEPGGCDSPYEIVDLEASSEPRD